MTQRYTIGPALGGEPPYCFILDRGEAWGLRFGPNIAVAEENAREVADRLNRESEAIRFRWLDALDYEVSAQVIPIRGRR